MSSGSSLHTRMHPTGVEVAQDRPGASAVLFWCFDRRVWLSGSRTDDHALTFGPIPLDLPVPDGETDEAVAEDAKRIAAGWFGRTANRRR